MEKHATFFEPIPYAIIEDNEATQGGPSFKDFLRFVAMRRSLAMAKEYEKLSGNAVEDDQKNFFLEMVGLKHNEIESLQHYESDGRVIMLEPKSQPPFAFWSENPAVKRFPSLEDACRFVMHRELEGYSLYLRLAELEEEIVTKRLFLFLVRLHKCSLNYVQNRLQTIVNPPGTSPDHEASVMYHDRSYARIA